MLLPLLSLPAFALQYQGTPVLTFRVDRPADDYVEGEVVLTKVRVHHCDASTTDVTVGATLDPVVANTVALPAGDHCALTFFWGSAMDIDGPSWTVRYAQSTTTVWLDTEIPPKSLTPYTVIAGTMPGGGPWLLASID